MTTKVMTEERPQIVALRDDVTVRAARARLTELRTRLTELLARAERPRGAVIETKMQRTAREEAESLDPVITAAERDVAAAVDAARRSIFEERRQGLRALDESVLRSVEESVELARQRAAFAEETTHLAGTRDDSDRGALFPMLVGWAEPIERARKQLAGPAPKRAAPGPRPGATRVRVMIDKLFDSDWNAVRLKGDVVDLDSKDARHLIKEGAVEVVEVKSA